MSQARQTYAGECEECQRTVRRPVTVPKNNTIPPEKIIRCKFCRDTVRCEPEADGLET